MEMARPDAVTTEAVTAEAAQAEAATADAAMADGAMSEATAAAMAAAWDVAARDKNKHHGGQRGGKALLVEFLPNLRCRLPDCPTHLLGPVLGNLQLLSNCKNGKKSLCKSLSTFALPRNCKQFLDNLGLARDFCNDLYFGIIL